MTVTDAEYEAAVRARDVADRTIKQHQDKNRLDLVTAVDLVLQQHEGRDGTKETIARLRHALKPPETIDELFRQASNTRHLRR